jgi:hypothetical protein
MARFDKRSSKGATIKASFSADNWRLRALGVHVLQHALQRKGCVLQ